MPRFFFALPGALFCLLLTLSGCASHVADLAGVRGALVAGHTDSALAQFERRKAKKQDLLYLLDSGYMLHAAGRWKESNDVFEAAERRAEELVTKSVSREAAAFLTSDRVRPYSGLPFELRMISWYRALNYFELGELDAALVEARKSTDRIARNSYADSTASESASARSHQEAFLHYMNGLIYAAGGEGDNAAVSFRLAGQLYAGASSVAGFDAPPAFFADFLALARRLDLAEDERALAGRARGGTKPETEPRNIVVCLESGFVPYREAVDLTLPIFKKDDWGAPGWYWDSYRHDLYSWRPGYYRGDVDLDHVLRIAFPRLVEPRTAVARVEVVAPDGTRLAAEPALNLDAVCRSDFEARLPSIFMKTVARAIAKELARKAADKKGEGWGLLVNLIGAATEAADTRSWTFLPSRIDLARLTLPPGPATLTVRFLDASGRAVDEQRVQLEVHPGRTEFVHFRSFR